MAIDDNTLYGLTGAQVKELPGKIEAVKGLARELTTDDYNWPTDNPDGVAIWLLDPGTYHCEGVKTYINSNYSDTNTHSFIVSKSGGITYVLHLMYNGDKIWWQYFNGNSQSDSSFVLSKKDVINGLNSTATDSPLSARQGKVLKDLTDSIAIRGAGAPTTSTVGQVGTLYEDTTNGKLYQCTNVSGSTYTWAEITKTSIRSATGRGQTGGLITEDLAGLFLAGKPESGLPYALMTGNGGGEYDWSYVRGVQDNSTGISSAYIGSYTYDWQEDWWSGKHESQLAMYSDLEGRVKQNAGAPTTSTVGTVGQLLEDTTNGDLYICTDATNPYVWEEVGSGGGGGPTVVQTTGTSQTDVMSQNAVTSMVFAIPSDTTDKIRIGNSNPTGTWGVNIGGSASQSGTVQRATNIGGGSSAAANASTAIGNNANVTSTCIGAVALGAYARPDSSGQVHIGSLQTQYGYNSSNYRLLSGLYDPQSDHDAATKGYVDTAVAGAGASAFTTNEWNALWA